MYDRNQVRVLIKFLHRLLGLAALAWAAGLLLTGARAGETTLIIGVGRDFLDGPDSRTFVHGSTNTWEALTYLDENLKARPWLAREWTSRDQCRTWVFRLKDRVLFHDRTPMTAALVRASILRIASSPKYDPAGVYRDLDRIETSGPLKLTFYLKKPCPDFPNRVSYYSSPVLHPKTFDSNGRLTGIIGTGPFCLEKARPGNYLRLKAFTGHWGPAPGYDQVVFRTLVDPQIRAMALMAGEVDALADVGAILPQQAGMFKDRPGICLKQVEVATTHYLLFNCKTDLFRQPRARHWLAGIAERGGMVRALAPKAGRVANDPFTPLARDWAFGNLVVSPQPPPIPVETSIRIVVHAGTLGRWPYLDIAQLLQARLETAGFSATIAVLEPGAYFQAIQKGNFHLALQPNTLMTGDPDFFYAYYVASNGPRYYGCGCPETDRLIGQARHETDFLQRRKRYQKLSQNFARDLPLLPLYHDISYYAHTDRVANFFLDQNFRPRLVDARPGNLP